MGLSDWPTMILLSPSQGQNLSKIDQQISTPEERTATCAVFFEPQALKRYWAATTPEC